MPCGDLGPNSHASILCEFLDNGLHRAALLWSPIPVVLGNARLWPQKIAIDEVLNAPASVNKYEIGSSPSSISLGKI